MKLKSLGDYVSATRTIPRFRRITSLVLIDRHNSFTHCRVLPQFIEDEVDRIKKSRNIASMTSKKFVVFWEKDGSIRQASRLITDLLIKDQMKIDKNFIRLMEAYIDASYKKQTNNFNDLNQINFLINKAKSRLRDFNSQYQPSESVLEKARKLNIPL